MDRYEKFINKEYSGSKRKNKMPVSDRAAQFASFAALTGHSDAIKETARLTDSRTELDEYEKAAVNDRLNLIMSEIDIRPFVEVTYFVPDAKKQGGRYVSYAGNLRRIDDVMRILMFSDGTEINIDDIIDITSDKAGG
ncbi:MAG: hypothetical protein SOW78_03200 [Clostridia bacterium]|nr:hypothetical protein [Clostridia bacterium]